MAVVKGAKRVNPKVKAAKQRWDVTRDAMGLQFGQRLCPWCKPRQWVRNAAWDAHYQQHVFANNLAREAKAAEKKAAQQKPPAPRPERPMNHTKPAAAGTSRNGSGVKPLLASSTGEDDHMANMSGPGHPYLVCRYCHRKREVTDGPCPCKKGSSMSSQNGERAPHSPQMSATAPEGIAEAFRMWAIVVPPSIPSSRFDAQAMADAYRRAADSLRMRVRTESEVNNLSESIMEPMLDAATRLSQLGDLHMEVVRRIEIRYGETAEILARPDTPHAEYLKQGR